MESPLETAHSGGRIWNWFLITVSILCCYIQSAQSAPLCIVVKPSYGTVGSNVSLDIQGFSGQPLSYTWYRKAVEAPNQIGVYSVLSGVQRQLQILKRVLPNGSLLISNLTLSDIDDYIVEIVDSKTGLIEAAKVHLSVYADKSPERNKGSSFSGGSSAVIVTGVLIGVALTGGLT
ncbi:cell adhesion molecule CEACAM3-like [Macrotis lagotis]|uniref:cell adhesion molecule CEACAM3-like n=1 Tax=Macrotis lagotis TaxID=92651 RepID=UPI003D6842DF